MGIKITIENKENNSFRRSELAKLEVDVAKLASKYGLMATMQVTHTHFGSIIPKLIGTRSGTQITTHKDGSITTKEVKVHEPHDATLYHITDEKYV